MIHNVFHINVGKFILLLKYFCGSNKNIFHTFDVHLYRQTCTYARMHLCTYACKNTHARARTHARVHANTSGYGCVRDQTDTINTHNMLNYITYPHYRMSYKYRTPLCAALVCFHFTITSQLQVASVCIQGLGGFMVISVNICSVQLISSYLVAARTIYI